MDAPLSSDPSTSLSPKPSPAPLTPPPSAPGDGDGAPSPKLVLTPDQVASLGCSGDCTLNLTNAVPGDDGSVTYDAEVVDSPGTDDEGDDGQSDILGYKRPAGPGKETPSLGAKDLES